MVLVIRALAVDDDSSAAAAVFSLALTCGTKVDDPVDEFLEWCRLDSSDSSRNFPEPCDGLCVWPLLKLAS